MVWFHVDFHGPSLRLCHSPVYKNQRIVLVVGCVLARSCLHSVHGHYWPIYISDPKQFAKKRHAKELAENSIVSALFLSTFIFLAAESPYVSMTSSQVKSGLQVQQEKRPAMTSVVKDLEGITRATWLIRLLRLIRLPLFKITLETWSSYIQLLPGRCAPVTSHTSHKLPISWVTYGYLIQQWFSRFMQCSWSNEQHHWLGQLELFWELRISWKPELVRKRCVELRAYMRLRSLFHLLSIIINYIFKCIQYNSAHCASDIIWQPMTTPCKRSLASWFWS